MTVRCSYINWEPPPHGVIKISTDGSAQNNPGPIATGGVARDEAGNWIFGFAGNMGIGTITAAELWGIWYGLEGALQRNIQEVKINCDSATAVKLVTGQVLPHHPLSSLIEACKVAMSKFKFCRILHQYRETNKAADAIANFRHSLLFGVQYYDTPHPSAGNALIFDLVGGTSVRNVIV